MSDPSVAPSVAPSSEPPDFTPPNRRKPKQSYTVGGFKSTNMTPCAHTVLRLIKERGVMLATDIVKAVDNTPLTVYRALRRLEARGLIVKRETPQTGVGRPPFSWALITDAPKPPSDFVEASK